MSEDIQAHEAAEFATHVVESTLSLHRAAAIPALIGACVVWAVEHGGAEIVKGSLRNAIKLADQLESDRRRAIS